MCFLIGLVYWGLTPQQLTARVILKEMRKLYNCQERDFIFYFLFAGNKVKIL